MIELYEKWKQLPVKCSLSGHLAIKAVSQDGSALQYVNEQTPEICKKAVSQNGCALQYVNEQTPEICKKAVSQNGCALQYVNEQIFTQNKIKIEANGKTVCISKESAKAIGLIN
jgi:hypothetical protein